MAVSRELATQRGLIAEEEPIITVYGGIILDSTPYRFDRRGRTTLKDGSRQAQADPDRQTEELGG